MTEEDKKNREEEETKKKEEEVKKVVEVEPDRQELKNPSRVVKAQEKKITFKEEDRWFPVLDNRFGGFIVLKD